MKILILTLGTQGDVQPYIALAQGLISKHHQVDICTSFYFKKQIEQYHIGYQFMNNEFIDLVNHKSSKTLLCGKSGILQKIRSLFTISRLSKKIIPLILRDTWQAANNVKPELIIAHPKVLSASHICEAFNIPLVIASPIPTFEATDEFPLVGLPQLTLFTHNQTKWYNKLTYKLSRRAFHVFDKTINDFRANTLGLSSCDPFSTPIKNHLNQSIIHLHAISPSVIHKPHDWRKLAYMTGYWFLEKTDNWHAPRLLTQFIAAKPEPIVYIGFGSMAANNAVALGQLIIQALKKSKTRAIIATGWGGIKIENQDLHEHICVIESAPHDWLFPQVAAVIHHGGAGSTAATLKAGKPALICPYSLDQPFWGKQIENLNVGPKAIHQKKLTTENLANALIQLTTNKTLINNAQKISEKINKEDGINVAINIIEHAFLNQAPINN